MSVVIEKARPCDAAEILEYMKQVGGETENLTFGNEGLPFSEEEERSYLKSLENSRDGVLLVAKDNGKIVGDAGLRREVRRMGHRGDLGISVVRDYWNKGIGSMLLSEIIGFAKQNGFDIIDLQVRCDNLPAIHLYEKFGFEKIGTHPAFFKMNGKEIPFDFMFLRIK